MTNESAGKETGVQISDGQTSDTNRSDSKLPVAEIRQQRGFGQVFGSRSFWATWWLPAACLLLAIVLVFSSMRARGPKLIIHFTEGHGLKAGDAVRYRGIDVGQVTDVKLNQKANGVDVTLMLAPNSRQLAREGARFWIERPRFSLSRVSGLETVVGAKYIGVLPGPETGRTIYEFDGLPAPPALQDAESAEIIVRFLQGHGLTVGDPLKHRGIIVGEVAAVELNPELDGVSVRLRLLDSAHQLARAGSQFWIERPKVSLTALRGLDTIVGGRYLAVLPGFPDAPPQSSFEGLETPPAADERLEGGLEIVLESPRRHGLEVGAPVSYRGLVIGHVIAVALAPDASAVEARVYVQPAYKSLVRDNSQFWSLSGFDVDIGISGVKVTAETLATIAAGGVAFATPENPGKPVATGHRFKLNEKGESSWSTWQPRLTLNNELAPHITPLPQPLRASLRWTEKKFGFSRPRQREGWVLCIGDERLLGPVDLLTVPQQAVDQKGVLEVNGRELPLQSNSAQQQGDAALLPVPKDLVESPARWPADRLRAATLPEDGVITPGWQEPSMILAAVHLQNSEKAWNVSPQIPIPADLHGAAVISSVDGKLVGIVFVEKGRARVALLSEEVTK